MMPDDEPFYDAHGRGPLAREWQRRCGFDPDQAGPGFASFARALDRAKANGREWPEQFRTMLAAAVTAVVEPVLAAERADRAAEVIELRAALEAARRAYAELKAEVVELRKAVGGNGRPVVPVRPRQAVIVGGK